ncbi:hypothetical protein HMPREF1177_00125 [Eikenella corrodens CC92I]|uniref:DUF5640 domain-containing protein n=2 Tax=Eikenella corrodens TaxID=539 RepID=V7IF07_EIKCO|nr:hypothetical protein HMPREF1177_00125 [Eikenella corrodens CC92I]
MKKLLSVLMLSLTLLLTACGNKPEAKPGEQFVGKWQDVKESAQEPYRYEIKRNGDSEDTFIVKTRGGKTFEGKLLDDTLTANYGALQFTIDPATGEMFLHNTSLTLRRLD